MNRGPLPTEDKQGSGAPPWSLPACELLEQPEEGAPPVAGSEQHEEFNHSQSPFKVHVPIKAAAAFPCGIVGS